MIRYKKDTDNIVTLTFDMTDRPINVLNHELTATFMPVIKYLQEEKKKKQLCGIILTSAKKTFMESGDLEYLYQTDKAEEIYQFTIKLKIYFEILSARVFLSLRLSTVQLWEQVLNLS